MNEPRTFNTLSPPQYFLLKFYFSLKEYRVKQTMQGGILRTMIVFLNCVNTLSSEQV